MVRYLAVVASLLAGVLAGPVHAQPAGPFAWAVENRFRLWSNAPASADRPGADGLLSAIAGPVTPEQVHDQMVGFLRQHPNLHRVSHWNGRTEQYDLAYVHAASYRVRIGLRQPPAEQGQMCRWTTSAGRFEAAEVPCEYSALLVVPADPSGRGSVPVTVSVRSGRADATLQTDRLQVRDRLIAAIGDSFSSGEGNPDLPSNFANLGGGLADRWVADWSTDRWLGRDRAVAGFGSADWWDPLCHRSFYATPMVAALKYAADHPQEAVTFVSFACSGAHVLQGLLVTQKEPPGFRDSPTAARLKLPQVEALVRNLCRPNANGSSSAVSAGRRTYTTLEIDPSGTQRRDERVAEQSNCADPASRRRLDALIVSIGGNDIGFAPVIFNGLLPRQAADGTGQRILSELRKGTRTPGQAGDYISYVLPDVYRALEQRLDALFPESYQTLQTEYPSPTRGEDGALCGPENELTGDALRHPHQRRLAAIGGVWPDQFVPADNRWHASIDRIEGRAVERTVVAPLNEAVAEFNARAGWTYVTGYAPAFARRGWCAGAAGQEAEFPEWLQSERRWATWNPATWNPYQRRARLFRTPNDSALTESVAKPRESLLFVSRRQEGLMAAMAGAFHPTFEGHVIMGLQVATRIQPAPGPSPRPR